MRHTLSSLLVATVALTAPLAAQIDDFDEVTYGPELRILSTGLLHFAGTTSYDQLRLPRAWQFVAGYGLRKPVMKRNIDYVVADLYDDRWPEGWPDAKVRRPFALARQITAQNGPLGFSHLYSGIEVVRGYCYFKIEQPPAEKWALPPIVATMQKTIAEEFPRLGPPILRAIREQARLDGDRLELVTAAMKTGMAEAAATPALWEALGIVPPGPASARSPRTVEALQQRWSALAEANDWNIILTALTESESAGRAVAAVAASTKASSDDPKVSDLMGGVKYPFVVVQRTVGGAEGTEVVVYVPEGDPGSDTTDVYYFYLHTHRDPAPTIKIGAHLFDASAPPGDEAKLIDAPIEVPPCHYARIPMGKYGTAEWFVTATSDVEIAPIDAHMPPRLLQVIRAAHRDACIAGIDPSPVQCGGPDARIRISCPRGTTPPADSRRRVDDDR